jgi:hypothetical protein
LDRTCVVYLDDILIYSTNEKEHEKHVREVLERLYDWDLYCKASKCEFFTKSVEFLGYVVTPGGVVMDPIRVKTIQDWPEPESYRDIQVFLGFANFYRRFVFNYSEVVRPLVDHMTAAQKPPEGQATAAPGKKKKGPRKGPTKFYKAWSWPANVAQAFHAIRERFMDAPVLRHFDPLKEVMVITDASDFAMAAILLQPQDTEINSERHRQPVAFWSRKFSGPEIRWHTHDKELCAIVSCFKEWRHYLEYAPSSIRVLSDHNNLRFFMTTKELSPKQARWAEELARYDFEIEHKPGLENPADGPSRRPDYASGLRIGEGEAMRAAMLPTLQQKLRVLAIRTRSSQKAGSQLVSKPSLPGEGANSPRLRSGDRPTTTDKEFPNTVLENCTTVPTSRDGIRTNQPEVTGEARTAEEVVTDLMRSCKVPMPTRDAVRAAAHETALALDTPDQLQDYIKLVQENDEAYQSIVQLVEKGALGKGRKNDPDWDFNPRGILRRAGKVWIPKDSPLRQNIMKRNHDDPVGGHYGKDKTHELLTRKYHWPHLTRDLAEYVSGCHICQLNKTRRHKPWGKLAPLPIPQDPWRHFSLDFVTDLPASKDAHGNCFDSVLVLIDRFTKYTRYLPVNKTITAKQLADLLYTEVFLRHGAPDTLVSDRGSTFTSQFWSDLCYHLNTEKRLSTAFHPQTDGQTERQNQELESFLRMYMNYDQDNWVSLAPYAEYAYNSKVHSSTKVCPIELAFGIKPKGFDGVSDSEFLRAPDPTWELSSASADIRNRVVAYLQKRADLWETARECLQKAQKEQARWYDGKRTDRSFAVGEYVILNAKNIKTKRPSKKFDSKYLGPFRITRRVGLLAYELDLPASMSRIHPVFHVSLLERWRDPPASRGFRPGPVQHPEIAGDHYEVEAILRHKGGGKSRKFLVKWAGWNHADNTWEPEEHLNNCEELLKEYWEHPIVEPSRRRNPLSSMADNTRIDGDKSPAAIPTGNCERSTRQNRERR